MRGYIINKGKRTITIGKKAIDIGLGVSGWASIVAVLYANILMHQMRQHKAGTKRTMGK